MKTTQTTIEKIKKHRTAYLNSLPQFQELFIEIMLPDSEIYLIQVDNNDIGYAIKIEDGILTEFYLEDKYISSSNEFFLQIIKNLSVKEIYCKSFDNLLLSNCMLSALPYSVLGVMYRDYVEALIESDPEIIMKKAELSSVELLLKQDDSIRELFETKEQLVSFISNDNVFEFYKNNKFVGCGMVLKTNIDWNYCDLGVWVNPSNRRKSIGSQIILKLREFALSNNMTPSCGCAIDNIASQKTIEKSGFVSKYKMISFSTNSIAVK